MRRFSLLLLLSASALVAAPAGAGAATQVGQTVNPSGSHCTPDDTWLQKTSPNNQYAIPFDGVITSWSFLGGSIVPSPLKLKLGTVAGSTMTIAGESSYGSPTPGQLNTFQTRIPAHANELIGFYFPEPGDFSECAVRQQGYDDALALGDVAPGKTGFPVTSGGNHLDISANLEPDCDRDGLGDETQDSDTSSCPPCNGQRATIVGTPRNDVLSGGPNRDVIVGLGGKDRLSGLAGNDVICGGPGKDTLTGGAGNDKLFGEAGKDTLKGGKGKDKLVGGPGKDKQVQ
ncbi:MAG: calcium-binding protein [Solirubrobacterales bacterium]